MNISYHSFLPHLGYGVAAKSYIGLIKENPAHHINWSVHQFGNQLVDYASTEFSGQPDLNFIHLTPLYIPNVFDRRCVNLANTVFETTQLPAEWKKSLDSVERVAVPCLWNKQVFEEALKKPVYLLPHLSQFCGQPPATADTSLALPDDKFIFLTVGTWELRKNLEQLVDAFCHAFSKRDDVVLLIKTSENDITRQRHNWRRITYLQKTTKTLQKLLRFRRDIPDIRLISTTLPDESLRELYHRCHAYVTLTHGEGWGLGAYEAAWFGKPVIATGYGGYLDFLKADNSFLTPYSLIRYKKNFWDDQDRSTHYYAQPDVDSAIAYMKHVYQSYEQGLQKGSRLRDYVQANFSRQTIASCLNDFLTP